MDEHCILVFVSFVSCKMCRLDSLDFRTFTECGYTLILVASLACAEVAFARKIRKARFCVSRDDAFVVSQNYLVRSLRNYVLRHYRSLTAAARSVNYEGRNSVAGGMSS